MGKVFERIVVNKMHKVFNERICDLQYGFREGRSTEDAIISFRGKVEGSNNKYVIGIFVDMTGAFDRVWWPGILDKLRREGVEGDLYGVIKDYLRGRYVSIRSGTWEVGKKVNRGCPQGSIMGPQLWKLVIDRVLRKLDEKFGVIAYADDVAIVIEGKSRKELEEKGREAAGILDKWCKEEKMSISKDKTVGVLLKGILDKERMPRIIMGGNKIRFVEKVSYLGVIWGRGMKIKDHITCVTERAYNKMMMVLRIMGNKGIEYKRILGIYRGMYLAMITYAAGAWGDKLGKMERYKLLSEQRKIGLRMTKGYRTLSGEAVRVIAGLIPLDLEVDRRWVHKRVKSRGSVFWEGKNYNIVGIKREIENRIMNVWQRRWEVSEKGRWTAGWWPDVRVRMRANWIQPSYYVTQLLGGHGMFKEKLQGFGLVESGDCQCGVRETVEHIMFECNKWSKERKKWNISREKRKELVSEQGFDDLREFAEEVLSKKEEEERE